MERRNFVKKVGLSGVGMAGILASGIAPAIAAQPTIRWRLASSFPSSLDTIYGAAVVLQQKLSELTGGKFQIEVSSPGPTQIVPPFGVVDAVQKGVVECCHTAGYYYVNKDPVFAMDCTIPFGMDSRQQMAWMYQGNGLKLLREFFDNYNIVNFPAGNTGTQMGGWYKKPIHSLEDLKGLKMRISTFAGWIVEKMGVKVVNLPGNKLLSALASGEIDAVEWVGPYDDYKLGFYKYAKHYMYPGWWEGQAQLSLYVNKQAWNSLPKEYQTAVELASAFSNVNMLAQYDKLNPGALKILLSEKGVILEPFSNEIMNTAYRYTQETYDELYQKNPAWRKIYPDWLEFRNNDALWFRVAEQSFDNFMRTRKL